jgi:hypothetical protein
MGNVEDRDHEHCCHPAPWSHTLNFGTCGLWLSLTVLLRFKMD